MILMLVIARMSAPEICPRPVCSVHSLCTLQCIAARFSLIKISKLMVNIVGSFFTTMALDCIVLHCSALDFTTMQIKIHFSTPHSITLLYIALHCMTDCCTAHSFTTLDLCSVLYIWFDWLFLNQRRSSSREDGRKRKGCGEGEGGRGEGCNTR